MKKLLDIISIRWSSNEIQNPLQFLKVINPMQFIIPKIPLTIYEITYRYTTSRGNRKDGIKYMVVNNMTPIKHTELLFTNWITEYNKSNKYRQLSNVKFLDSRLIMSLEI